MASGRATLREFSRTQSCHKGDARTTIAEPLSAKVQSESCSYRHPTFASNFRVVPRRFEYARRFCPGGQRRRCLLYAPASDSRVVSVGETVGIDVSEDVKCWSEWQDLNLRPPSSRTRYASRLLHRSFTSPDSVQLPHWASRHPWWWAL